MTTNRKIGVALTADPSQLQAGLRTASSAAQQFAASTDQAFGRVSASTARLSQASTALGAATNQQTLAGRAHQAAADRFVRDLERKVTAIGKTRSELLSLQAAELGVANQAAPLIARIRESEQALGAGAIEFNKFGLSAKQTEAALRGVPAQITDIVVSLQSGQRPMTVLLQQGGQLKDMFGGVVPAAKALSTTLLGMVNPYTVAAAGAAALFAAYRSGSSELDAFNQHLTMTGGALGMSANQVSAFAEQMDRVAGVTRGGAVRALTDVATSGKIAGDQMQMVAEVALRSSQLLGRETAEVIDEFAKLADEPSKAAAELNEKYNFLTTSVYRQIRALEEQGRTQDAARLASEEFGRVTTERLGEVERSLGYIARSWRAVSSVAKEAWDTMANLGRPSTISEMIAESESRLDQLRDAAYERGAVRRTEQVRQEEALLASLRAQLDSEEEALGLEQARAEIRKNFIEAEQRWQKGAEEFLTKSQRMEKEISQARADGLRLKLSEHEIEQRIAAIRDKYTQKQSGGISTTQTELARLNALMEAERQREEALHSVGLAQANLNEGERLAIQYAEKLKLATDEKTKSQLTANKALAEEYGARKRANDVFEKELKDRQSAIDAAEKQTERLRDEIETYGMGRSAVEAMTIARLEERVAMADPAVSDSLIESLKREIAARKELYDAMRTKEQLDAQLKEWQNWEREVDRIFDQLGQSLTDQLFEGGKSGRDLLKDMFKALTLRVVVQPMMAGLQGMVTQQIGGMLGFSDPRQQGGGMLGTAQNLYSGYNAMSGGLSGTLGNAAQWLGQKVGSEALTSFGLGLSGTTAATGIASIGAGLGASLGTSIGTSAAAMTTTTFSAALGGGAAAGGAAAGGAAAAAGGAAGFGSAVGAALPWIGGALAIGSLLGGGLFDREPTTRREQRTQVEYGGGIFDVTKVDDRAPAGADAAARALAEQAVQTANEIFRQVGVDAAIDSFHAIMASSYQGDRDGVASGGMLRLGDELRQFGIDLNDPNPTIQGFGGWSSAETLPRLATDIQLSVLEAFQSLSDQLPNVLASMLEGIDIRSLGEQEAQALAERFTLLTQGASQFLAAIETMPFEQLRDLSFDAAAGMVQFAGGIDNLLSAQQTYYERFYSDAERHGHAVDQLTQALAGVGVEMPALVGSTDDMLASYRALVESLDLNTEAGQQAYVTLMQVSGAFADVAQFAGQAAREREGLERQLLQLQGDTAALRARELEALDASNHALQRYIWSLQDQRTAWDAAVTAGESAFSALSRSVAAEKTRLQRESEAIATALRDSISAASTTVSELTSLTGRLTSTVQRMAGQLDEGRNFAWAQERVDRALSVAKLTGVIPLGADFEQALQIVAQPSEGLYSSFEDYQADFLKTAHTVSELNELAEGQLSTEKRALKALEDQLTNSQEWYRAEMERLDLMLEQERQHLDIAMGTYEAVLTIPEALAGIQSAIANIQLVAPPPVGGGGGGGGGGGSYPSNSTAPGSPYDRASAYYKANPDVANAWNAGTGMTYDEFARHHYETYGRYEGRSYDVGTPYVPYDMRANIHKGEIIIDPRSSDILRRYGIGVQGGGNDAALRLVQQELREMRRMQQTLLEEISRNTNDTARTNRQMTMEPQPVHVTNVVPTIEAVPGQ